MRSAAEVEEIRQQRSAQEATEQMLQRFQGAAETYPKLAKKPEEGSPAEAIGAAVGAA